jgi:hypothetical protein
VFAQPQSAGRRRPGGPSSVLAAAGQDRGSGSARPQTPRAAGTTAARVAPRQSARGRCEAGVRQREPSAPPPLRGGSRWWGNQFPMSATSGAAAGGNSPVASGATAEKIAEVVNKNHNLRPFSKDGLKSARRRHFQGSD